MKNITIKVLFIIMLLIIIFSINTKVFAWNPIIDQGKDFISAGETSGEAQVSEEGLKELSGYLYNILLAVGIVVAVVVATILGIQFMISGAEGQAKIKEMLVPFIAGCIIVFGGFGFWKVAVTIGEKLEPSDTDKGKPGIDRPIENYIDKGEDKGNSSNINRPIDGSGSDTTGKGQRQ